MKDLDDPETADPQSGPSGVQSKPKRTGNSHEKTKERPKKKAKLDPTDSSTENESDYSLQESDEEFRLSTPSEEEPDFGIPEGPEIVPGVFLQATSLSLRYMGKKVHMQTMSAEFYTLKMMAM